MPQSITFHFFLSKPYIQYKLSIVTDPPKYGLPFTCTLDQTCITALFRPPNCLWSLTPIRILHIALPSASRLNVPSLLQSIY